MVCGVDDRAGAPRDPLSAHEGRCLPARMFACRKRRVEHRHLELIGDARTPRVETLGQEQVARHRQRRVRTHAARADTRDRVGDNLLDRHVRVGEAVHERGVGAVLEQPAHEIRQQVLVAPHRRVDAAGDAELGRRHDLFVQAVAHAEEALELECVVRQRALGCVLDDRRRGVGVVRRKHRVQAVVRGEDAARADKIREVRVRLARKYRIAGETLYLRTLDLGVPVRTLH